MNERQSSVNVKVLIWSVESLFTHTNSAYYV